MNVTYQIPREPTEDNPRPHPVFIEIKAVGTVPRVGDYIDHDGMEYVVKVVLWKDLNISDALVILE